MLERLREAFSLDRRSLVAFRVSLGTVFASDLVFLRWADIRAHYTDLGVFPRVDAAMLGQGLNWFFSPFFWTGSPEGVMALFALGVVLSVLFAIGYETKLLGAALLVLSASLNHRNYLVRNGGDLLIQALFFWSLFMPLDGKRAAKGESVKFKSLIGFVFALQLCEIYLSAGVAKLAEPVWREGRAIEVFLSYTYITSSLGALLPKMPTLSQWMNHLVLALEILVPLVFLACFKNSRVRMACVWMFIGLHAGIALSFDIMLFPLISIVCWIPVIPGEFWERLGWRGGFDGSKPTERNSLAWVAEWFAAICLILILLGDSWIFTFSRIKTDMRAFHGAGMVPLKQGWNMFTKLNPIGWGWPVSVVQLEDGRRLNYLDPEAPPNWDYPRDWSHVYPGRRWFNYAAYLIDPPRERLRSLYLEYLCGEWNSRHPVGERAALVELYFVDQKKKSHDLLSKSACPEYGK